MPPPYGKVYRRAKEGIRRYWWGETEGRRHFRKEKGKVSLAGVCSSACCFAVVCLAVFPFLRYIQRYHWWI